LTPTLSELALNRPLYHYENQAKKARALKEKLDEDASLAQAAIRRERARDAERALPSAKRRKQVRRS
jgi:hypothetical protein